MLSYIFSHARRKIGTTLCMILVALLISASFCVLEQLKRSEQENYERMYRSIPITVSAADLTGRKTEHVGLPSWAVDVFLPGGRALPQTLDQYVVDIRAKAVWTICDYQRINGEDVSFETLVGINTVEAEDQLLKNNGGSVTWFEGYDDNVLSGTDPVCLLPQDMLPDTGEDTTVSIGVSKVESGEEGSYTIKRQIELKVVGTYSAKNRNLYLPYRQAEGIWTLLDKTSEFTADFVKMTLRDNDLLEEFREASLYWFAKPDIRAIQVPWGRMGHEFYPFSLAIDDSKLIAAGDLLNKSMLINNICRQILFAVSAGVGFLVGFLMIRSRQREIILMRTMGTPTVQVFGSFALEQMVFVLAGILLGGLPFRWQPLNQLVLFGAVYAVGLCLALVIFLKKNLMSTMKEEE